jgi:hypothetical protein
MKITPENIRKFVLAHGDVNILDTGGKTLRLRNGDPDFFDLVEKADRFQYNNRWYTRPEFEKLLDATGQ